MSYLLTKGSVSIVRKDAEGVQEAMKRGFVISGECDASGKITSDKIPEAPKLEEKKPDELEKLTVEKLKEKLAELKVEIPEKALKADLVALLKKAME